MKPAHHFEPVTDIVDAGSSTERRPGALSAALAASEARYLAVLSNATQAVWTIDPRSGAVVSGAGWQALTGQTTPDMLGFGWMAVVEAEDREKVADICRGVLLSAAPRECEFRVEPSGGGRRVLHFKLTAVHAADRSIQEWIGISTDITDRVRVRRADLLAVSRDVSRHIEVLLELHEAQTKNREIRTELAHVRRITLLGTLAGSIAHELRQPLTAIMANARAAHRFLERPHPDVASAIESLDDIVRDDRRASHIIEHFRSLLKGDQIPETPCDLNDAVGEVVRVLRSDAANRQITIRCTLDETVPTVRGDRVQLQQVVLNLAMNALDAVMDPQAVERTVSIRTTREPDGAATVTVEDDGPPLSDDQFGRMQQPFYTTKPEGLGLGLSICREILAAHSSELRVEPKHPGGLRLSFRITKHPE